MVGQPIDTREDERKASVNTSTTVFVSRNTLNCVWVVVMFAHCGCAMFLGAVGMPYRYLPTTSLDSSFTVYSVSVGFQYFAMISNMYCVLASIHIAMFTLYVVRSIRYWELVFRIPPTRRSSSCTSNQALDRITSYAAPSSSRIASQALTKISPAVRLAQTAISLRISKAVSQILAAGAVSVAAMDIHNENYGLFFLFRELLQTFMQTYQAYRLSYPVPRLWMNNVIVSFLVLNCWSTPLIELKFRSNLGKTRLGCAIVSVMLDIVSCIVAPLVLFKPYYNRYDSTMRTFDNLYWYTDKWLIQMINELQLLFVTSLYDAISKFVIALSVARWLYAITKLVESASNQVQADAIPTAVHVFSVFTVAPAPLQTPTASAVRVPSRKTRRRRVEAAGHKLLVIWGALFLGVHVYAASFSDLPQCRLHSRPWFSMKPGCSLLEFNCVQENATGRADEIERLLQRVDANYIEHLVIRHCSNLQVPPYLENIKYLLAMKIFNASTLEWGEDAALTNVHHPVMQIVYLVEVNIVELPQRLLSDDFPQTLH